jgi:isoquinoline 1-oxidoreductase alpha subunit
LFYYKKNSKLSYSAAIPAMGNNIMTKFILNGQEVTSSQPADTPLLWVIRDEFGLKGTKFGCGIAYCGACTVHFNGMAIRSCVTTLSQVENTSITTIEGLDENNQHPLQQAWVAEQVPQCGYCQSGQIMQAAELLSRNSSPDDAEIISHMDGNLCRCMSYTRIKKAIKLAAQMQAGGK